MFFGCERYTLNTLNKCHAANKYATADNHLILAAFLLGFQLQKNMYPYSVGIFIKLRSSIYSIHAFFYRYIDYID